MFIQIALGVIEFQALNAAIDEKDPLRRSFDEACTPRERQSFLGCWVDVDIGALDHLLKLAREFAPSAVPAIENAIERRN
ncbi:MAG TPA: hypothetical protein VGH16_21835 [Candidatus Binatia bacterium]